MEICIGEGEQGEDPEDRERRPLARHGATAPDPLRRLLDQL